MIVTFKGHKDDNGMPVKDVIIDGVPVDTIFRDPDTTMWYSIFRDSSNDDWNLATVSTLKDLAWEIEHSEHHRRYLNGKRYGTWNVVPNPLMTPLPVDMRPYWHKAVDKLIRAGWSGKDAEREVNAIAADKRNWHMLGYRYLSGEMATDRDRQRHAGYDPLPRRAMRDERDARRAQRYSTNPVATPADSLVGIGHFISLSVRTASGIDKSIRPKHGEALWLAWKGDPDTGDLIIVEPGTRAKPGTEETAQHHKTFHGVDPSAWQNVAWYPPHQPLERLGFATAITYRIPGKMPSNKVSDTNVPTDWKHRFGDFGALDNQSADTGLHPAVARGVDGSIYLMRRPRNKYRLADWLYG